MKEKSSRNKLSTGLNLVPYSFWTALFVLIPIGFIAYYAFTDADFHFTFSNITEFFTSITRTTDKAGNVHEVRTYLLIFWRSLKLSLISTLICLLIGYPIALIISSKTPKVQKILTSLIMIPMWMNFLIRTYAWMTILQDTGLINRFLDLLGLGNIHIIGTEGAVIIGMVYDFLPYMIIPIYSVMSKIDPKLFEAAMDLGCNRFNVIKKVILPLSIPGIVSGVTMVLIPSISTFYISQKLGNGKFYLIGDAIEGQYVAGNLHFAAAIAFIMMVILLVGMSLARRFTDKIYKGGGN